jgi:peptide deformylase
VAVREILLYPHPLLKQVCEPLAPTDPRAPQVAQDLLDTLESGPGVGLAAPQIGYRFRVIVVEAGRNPRREGQGRFLLFNPVLPEAHGRQTLREGCLSIPQYTGNVTRAAEVVVNGLDASGDLITLRAREYEAVVFQHELDHLDGILFLDRITRANRNLFRRKP